MRVQASGLDEQVNELVSAGLGETRTVNFTLKVAAAKQDITVGSEAPLINVEGANTTTTITGRSIQDLPNPGGDLTYPAQFAPGALINTAGSSNDFVGGHVPLAVSAPAMRQVPREPARLVVSGCAQPGFEAASPNTPGF
jgi:hypothetical protein